jgi:hypothetical protein
MMAWSKRAREIRIAVVLWIVAMPAFAQIKRGATSEELAAGSGTVVKVLDDRMDPAELKTFLQKRISGEMFGPFKSYTSLLWAVYNVGVWAEGAGVGDIQLQSPYPEDYKPTWKELMDALARQVDCSWQYNHDTGYWVFEKKRMDPPFALKIAKGWGRRDEGESVFFVPPIAPVGMDVYVMGHYSSDDRAKRQDVFANARRHVSRLFARRFKSDLAESDFTAEKVCGETAWYFSAPTPRDPKLKWRQWAFVKNGWCFMIVSVISEENESKLLPDVKAMIASFEVPDRN